MTNLDGSRFTELLPSSVAASSYVKALAYAVGNQISQVKAYADGAKTYASIATMPETVLDLLAVELNTPAYDESYSISIKRALIEGSMTFYMQMGTPAAVNKIIETIFTSGYIVEWFDYDGDPFHFKAVTTNPTITNDDVETFKTVLSSVKRLSAWLDEIILDLSTDPMETHFAAWVHTGDFITLNRATL